MKTSLFVSAVLMSVLVAAVPACGGESDSSSKNSSGPGPATHATECSSLCDRVKEADAGCTSDDASCLMVCATVTGYPSCQKQIDKWLSCAKKSAISCDASGTPTFDDCSAELLTVTACALTVEPPEAIANSCKDYCKEVDAAGCTLNSTLVDSSLADCGQVCGVAGLTVSKCQDKFVALTKCQAKAGVTCDSQGNPQIVGCESELLIYGGCVALEVGQGTVSQ